MKEFINRLPSSFDGFDMDLLTLFPDLRKVPDVALADLKPLWVYSNPGGINGDRFSHPATWNGFGAPYFSSPPEHPRNQHGWVTFSGGLTTNAPLCCVSALDAVRDTWCHHLAARLDGREWMESIQLYNPVFYPLMSHRRRWKKGTHEQAAAWLDQAMDWAIDACGKAVLR